MVGAGARLTSAANQQCVVVGQDASHLPIHWASVQESTAPPLGQAKIQLNRFQELAIWLVSATTAWGY